MMNEKMDIQNKYEDLKRSLNKSEEESEIYREQLTRVEKMSQKLLEGEHFSVEKGFFISLKLFSRSVFGWN